MQKKHRSYYRFWLILSLFTLKLFAQNELSNAELVYFASQKERGSIVVKTKERKLYLILGNNLALQYPIAVGQRRYQFFGTYPISKKAKWPTWIPTNDILFDHPELPPLIKGGPKNPLGARALYLGNSPYRIHGTNNPRSIGKAASRGCIRMHNKDVKELYEKVEIGCMVYVQ